MAFNLVWATLSLGDMESFDLSLQHNVLISSLGGFSEKKGH